MPVARATCRDRTDLIILTHETRHTPSEQLRRTVLYCTRLCYTRLEVALLGMRLSLLGSLGQGFGLGSGEAGAGSAAAVSNTSSEGSACTGFFFLARCMTIFLLVGPLDRQIGTCLPVMETTRLHVVRSSTACMGS